MKMKLQKFNLKDFHSKDWWIKELKQIRWTEIFLLIALIMCYLQVQHIKEVAQDPCNYCIVNTAYGDDITCKEYFNTNLNIGEIGDDFTFGNLSITEDKRKL